MATAEGTYAPTYNFRKTCGEEADVEAETRLGELKTDSLILSKHVYDRIKVAFK